MTPCPSNQDHQVTIYIDKHFDVSIKHPSVRSNTSMPAVTLAKKCKVGRSADFDFSFSPLSSLQLFVSDSMMKNWRTFFLLDQL